MDVLGVDFNFNYETTTSSTDQCSNPSDGDEDDDHLYEAALRQRHLITLRAKKMIQMIPTL